MQVLLWRSHRILLQGRIPSNIFNAIAWPLFKAIDCNHFFCGLCSNAAATQCNTHVVGRRSSPLSVQSYFVGYHPSIQLFSNYTHSDIVVDVQTEGKQRPKKKKETKKEEILEDTEPETEPESAEVRWVKNDFGSASSWFSSALLNFPWHKRNTNLFSKVISKGSKAVHSLWTHGLLWEQNCLPLGDLYQYHNK